MYRNGGNSTAAEHSPKVSSSAWLYTDTYSWSQPDKSTAWFITSPLIRHDTSFKWTPSFVPANPFLIYGRPDSSNLIFSLSHIDKLKIREVQVNSLSSERPSLLLETHFQHRWPSTTELQELSLIHIVTCLQKFKIEKQTNQRRIFGRPSLEGRRRMPTWSGQLIFIRYLHCIFG